MPLLTDLISPFITDAEGHWHDLTKGAFDAFTIEHPEAPAKVGREMFNQPLAMLAQTVKDATLSKVGEYKKAFAAGAGALITGTLARYAGAETLGAYVGGPVGAALGIGVEMGYEWLLAFVNDNQDSYKQGQWVILNLGMKPRQEVLDEPQFYPREFVPSEYTVWGQDKHVPDLQVGFYIGLAAKVGQLTCFNFRSGQAIDLDINLIQAVPLEKAKEFDRTLDMSQVKELFFAEAEGIQLNSEVPTDPGSEVVYKGESYSVVSCYGLSAIIEDVSGAQLTVPLSELKRGRVPNNRSWFYRAEGRAGAVKSPYYTDPESRANFQADGDGQKVHGGQWCWFPALEDTKVKFGEFFNEIKSVLCCVSHLEGNMVCVYQALDGKKRWESEKALVPCQEELDSMFNTTPFLDFREAVSKGVDVDLARLGADFPGVCLGFTKTGLDAKRDDSENWSKIPVTVEKVAEAGQVRVVGDRQMAKRLDAAQEISVLNPQIANAASVYWGQVENICSDPQSFGRRLVSTSVSCESGATKAAETTDNTMLIAGACAVGLGFYMYAG